MFKQIYIDGKRGNDSNSGESWDEAWESVTPLSHVRLKKEDRLYVRAQNLEHGQLDDVLKSLASAQGHPELGGHHVVLHEEHYYVDGVGGDDSSDGDSWETAVRTP